MYDINSLLEKPCYIIDFLPKTVTKNSSDNFFKVENYLLNTVDHYGLGGRIVRIILKIMCYYNIAVDFHEFIENPNPEQVVEIINDIIAKQSGSVNIILPEKNTLIVCESDCLHLSVYNPDSELCDLLAIISLSEGMFFRS